MSLKQLLKRGFHGLYVSAFVLAATVQMEGGQAFANTQPIAPPSGSGLGTFENSISAGSGKSVFVVIGSLVNDVVGIAGAVALAYTVYELYKAIIGFMRGGANAQRREEAKVHLLHVAVGAVLVGGSGLVLGVLYGLLKTLGA